MQAEASLNSLAELSPLLFVGMLVGEVSDKTTMGNVAPLLYSHGACLYWHSS